jgi:NAD(P)-dependent dehydrogenase (short-subunit alcohol dehydrogenase family)
MTPLYDSTLAQIPQGRMGSAEEVANAVVFLASPAASLITGVNLVADGGFTKRVQL